MATTARSGRILITTVSSDNPPEVLTPRKLTSVSNTTEPTPTATMPLGSPNAGKTRDAAEAYGVKAVLFTAQKPAT